MDNKCSKYEELFFSSDKEKFEQHIQECESCRLEYETQQKVSSLLSEVKLYDLAKRKKGKVKLKVACAAMLLLFSVFSFAEISLNNEDLMETLKYGDTLTAEELGFPVDTDGFLMVDE